MELPLTEMEVTAGGSGLGKGDNQKLSVECINFELPTRYPGGIYVGICDMKFREEIRFVFLTWFFFITFIII